MVRAQGVRAAAIAALIGCAHQRVDPFGEPLPVECEAVPESRHCLAWLIDRVLSQLLVQRYDDAAIAAYVDRVGERLLRTNGTLRGWTFVIVDDGEVQGMAGFGTTVFVTRGALGVLRSEAELAGLLGHEIGHVLADHAHENFDELGRDTYESPADESRHTRYHRDDEIQADELAVVLAARAGYDPHAVETMLRAVAATSPSDGLDPTASHPPWTERIARVQAIAAQLPAGEIGRERYHAAMQSLIAGANPLIADVEPRAVVFAKLGVALDLPAAAHARLEGSHVEVTVPTGSATLHLISARLPVDNRDRDATTFVVPGRGAIIFDANASIVRELRSALRPARRDELAAIRPQHVDLDAPRVLWTP